jgi:hypothetical protein
VDVLMPRDDFSIMFIRYFSILIRDRSFCYSCGQLYFCLFLNFCNRIKVYNRPTKNSFDDLIS